VGRKGDEGERAEIGGNIKEEKERSKKTRDFFSVMERSIHRAELQQKGRPDRSSCPKISEKEKKEGSQN